MSNRRYDDTDIVNIDYKRHGDTDLKNVRKLDHYIYPYPMSSLNDIYIITRIGDRLDLIADEYYNDTTLWWYIALANSLLPTSYALEPNTKLRIPPKYSNPSEKIRNFNKANR